MCVCVCVCVSQLCKCSELRCVLLEQGSGGLSVDTPSTSLPTPGGSWLASELTDSLGTAAQHSAAPASERESVCVCVCVCGYPCHHSYHSSAWKGHVSLYILYMYYILKVFKFCVHVHILRACVCVCVLYMRLKHTLFSMGPYDMSRFWALSSVVVALSIHTLDQ